MGGRGSGRRNTFSGKPNAGTAWPLDIRKLFRYGLLTPGNTFEISWYAGSREVSKIGIEVGGELQSLVLSYRRHSSGECIDQQVQTETSACYLGGHRCWFTCPQCFRRVAVLYAPVRYFACRRCCGLTYASQKENSCERASTKADKIRKRLGWQVGIARLKGGKPKGMHWQTFWRLTSEHDAVVKVALHNA